MKGAKSQFKSIILHINQQLLHAPSANAFIFSFKKIALESLNATLLLIDQMEADLSIRSVFQEVILQMKKAIQKHNIQAFQDAQSQDSDRSARYLQTDRDEVQLFLNSRRPLPQPNKERGEFYQYLTQSEDKQKDLQQILENAVKHMSRTSQQYEVLNNTIKNTMHAQPKNNQSSHSKEVQTELHLQIINKLMEESAIPALEKLPNELQSTKYQKGKTKLMLGSQAKYNHSITKTRSKIDIKAKSSKNMPEGMKKNSKIRKSDIKSNSNLKSKTSNCDEIKKAFNQKVDKNDREHSELEIVQQNSRYCSINELSVVPQVGLGNSQNGQKVNLTSNKSDCGILTLMSVESDSRLVSFTLTQSESPKGTIVVDQIDPIVERGSVQQTQKINSGQPGIESNRVSESWQVKNSCQQNLSDAAKYQYQMNQQPQLVSKDDCREVNKQRKENLFKKHTNQLQTLSKDNLPSLNSLAQIKRFSNNKDTEQQRVKKYVETRPSAIKAHRREGSIQNHCSRERESEQIGWQKNNEDFSFKISLSLPKNIKSEMKSCRKLNKENHIRLSSLSKQPTSARYGLPTLPKVNTNFSSDKYSGDQNNTVTIGFHRTISSTQDQMAGMHNESMNRPPGDNQGLKKMMGQLQQIVKDKNQVKNSKLIHVYIQFIQTVHERECGKGCSHLAKFNDFLKRNNVPQRRQLLIRPKNMDFEEQFRQY